MKLFSRVTIGLLWIAGSIPVTANTIWVDGTLGNAGTNAGSLPATAQMIPSGNWWLDQISGNLPFLDSAAMFQIWIADPSTFTATVTPLDTVDPATQGTIASQVIPQLFLFDSAGLPLAGGWAGFTGDATLPPWFNPAYANVIPDYTNSPGSYYLMVTSVGVDPVFTMPDLTTQPLFCASSDTSSFFPCPVVNPDPITGVGVDPAFQPISGYQGWGGYNAGSLGIDPFAAGAYAVTLTGVTSPVPEPGTVFLFLTGAALILAGKKRPSVAAFARRVKNRL
jgi:hypothetical protein